MPAMRRIHAIVSAQSGALVGVYGNLDFAHEQLEKWQRATRSQAKIVDCVCIEPSRGGTHVAEKPDFDLCSEILEG